MNTDDNYHKPAINHGSGGCRICKFIEGEIVNLRKGDDHPQPSLIFVLKFAACTSRWLAYNCQLSLFLLEIEIRLQERICINRGFIFSFSLSFSLFTSSLSISLPLLSFLLLLFK